MALSAARSSSAIRSTTKLTTFIPPLSPVVVATPVNPKQGGKHPGPNRLRFAVKIRLSLFW